MSEEKKNIPIEDGNEEEVKAEAEAAAAEAEAKDADAATDEGTEGDAAEKAPETEEKAEPEQSAEEAESERYMRLMAEFQNFKKRAAKEKSDIHAFANERIVNDLLPVLDNFERALGGESEGAGAETPEMSEEVKNYAKGMELICGQLRTALEKAGLKEIAALGEDFDPAFHNAVMTESLEEFEDGKISKVLQKGYTLNDRVIRPSMVAVNKK